MKTAHHSPSAWRDLQRDWEDWSPWERRFVRVLAIGSSASAVFWFAMSVNLVN